MDTLRYHQIHLQLGKVELISAAHLGFVSFVGKVLFFWWGRFIGCRGLVLSRLLQKVHFHLIYCKTHYFIDCKKIRILNLRIINCRLRCLFRQLCQKMSCGTYIFTLKGIFAIGKQKRHRFKFKVDLCIFF